MSSSGKGFKQLLSGAILGRIFGAAANIFLGRVLGTSGFGALSLYLQLIQTSESVNRFGIDFALSYWIADDPGLKKRRSHALISTALQLSYYLSAVTLIVCAIYLSFPRLGFPWLGGGEVAWMRVAILIGIGCECLSNLPWAILLVQRNMRLVALQQGFFGPLKLLAASIGGWYGSLDGSIIGWSLGSAFQLLWLHSRKKRFNKQSSIKAKVRYGYIRKLLHEGLPFYSSSLINQVVFFPLIVGVANSAGVADVSFLRVGQIFAQLFGLASGALAPILFLKLRSSANNQSSELILRRSLQSTWAFGLIGFSLFCLFDYAVIKIIFGVEYLGSVGATRILVSCSVLDALSQVWQQAMLAKGKVKQISIVLNLTGLICALAGWFLVPQYGMNGYLMCRIMYSLIPNIATLGFLKQIQPHKGPEDWMLVLASFLMLAFVFTQIVDGHARISIMQTLVLIAIPVLAITSAQRNDLLRRGLLS